MPFQKFSHFSDQTFYHFEDRKKITCTNIVNYQYLFFRWSVPSVTLKKREMFGRVFFYNKTKNEILLLCLVLTFKLAVRFSYW